MGQLDPSPPRTKARLATMRLTAAAALKLITTDKEVMDEEIKTIIQIIHHYFTDEPGEAVQEAIEKLESIDEHIAGLAKEVNEAATMWKRCSCCREWLTSRLPTAS